MRYPVIYPFLQPFAIWTPGSYPFSEGWYIGNRFMEKHVEIVNDEIADEILKSKSTPECLSSFIQSKSTWMNGATTASSYQLEIEGVESDKDKFGGKECFEIKVTPK